MDTLQLLRNSVERSKGKQHQLENTIESLDSKIQINTDNLEKHQQALEIIKEVGLKTQKQLQFHISAITSMALEAVFTEPYRLVVDFVERRNKTECDLFFERDGMQINPMEASGGGAIDVASFALRIASWSMQYPRLRNVIILDEPMRYLSTDLQEKASLMIKEISDKLGIQFIIVTHEQALTMYADSIFNVDIKNGVSQVLTN